MSDPLLWAIANKAPNPRALADAFAPLLRRAEQPWPDEGSDRAITKMAARRLIRGL